MNNRVFLLCVIFGTVTSAIAQNSYYYLKRCRRTDPQINACLQKSANTFIAYMNHGIPELRLAEPEPLVIDEIGIALGNGPNGYRATFRDINAFGVSNMTITAVRSDLDSHQFQFTLFIPHISARAKYVSSGVLILVQASGGGDYWGEYDGVRAKVYVKAQPVTRQGRQHLTLQQIKMDFSVKEIQMGVTQVHNGNAVLEAALNLFINSNAQELLKEMKPDLKKKLTHLLWGFMENTFESIPYDEWII
ncbi:hypothetical protein PPYR_09318 [Photinus pyralis]|uniref:Haemolymph juvenile hormone binding protein n=1 Tax=Photinus pyralis TaxID=7054 RepID=A0A5N4ALY7_PHOPY|nr:protein takeout-like [Photinus pyralis]XP_031344702.1 protein takeout-like [Photinus pyralis]KAB0798321.1 hypothetical protein PPYR_09314 [Photinus pyralis]KAB0798325.1 hypothetical protein PPYR_09318 [Photinus pyralis]